MGRMLRGVLCVVLPLVIVGCGGTKVARVSSDAAMDLSGKWNDTDSRLVSEEMIKDALSQRWLYKWEAEGKTPNVIVGKVVNKSHEHISVEAFTKDIERALLNSGSVNFVAARSERNQLRAERDEQELYASEETMKEHGEEIGADFMMMGSINTIVDQEGKRAVIYYQVNMELVNIETNAKVWIGEKKIKKYVEKSSAKF
ncbi:MAG: penicillin-binding protein activator LpoB [Chitinispirillales bacterium]|jgi:uncharacterized protein (TIGR02722 family)|nr:penicillin-binding protein activator LpoB [Chitinispirillales bacterium]